MPNDQLDQKTSQVKCLDASQKYDAQAVAPGLQAVAPGLQSLGAREVKDLTFDTSKKKFPKKLFFRKNFFFCFSSN